LIWISRKIQLYGRHLVRYGRKNKLPSSEETGWSYPWRFHWQTHF
jgi:hypothetical protein